jgi:hypothetical protein
VSTSIVEANHFLIFRPYFCSANLAEVKGASLPGATVGGTLARASFPKCFGSLYEHAVLVSASSSAVVVGSQFPVPSSLFAFSVPRSQFRVLSSAFSVPRSRFPNERGRKPARAKDVTG